MNSRIEIEHRPPGAGPGSLERMVSSFKPIREYAVCWSHPKTNTGGALEMKHGKLCLRKGDTVRALPEGGYEIIREWWPPINGIEFDQDIYPTTANSKNRRRS